MPEAKKYQIALFGAGRIGHIHAANIAGHPETALKYVIDPAGDAASLLARKFAASRADEAIALSDPAVAAIVIASATDTHAALVEKGLKAEKAVFCEKPIDLSIDRVNACLTAIKGCRQPLFLAFNRRFDPAIAEMRRRIVAGEIGDLELVTVISKDPGALPIAYLKASGGVSPRRLVSTNGRTTVFSKSFSRFKT